MLFDGGAMCGIFSGAIVAGLEKANIYNKIEAVYAGSAGAFNAAYFLAKQTEQGANVYFDYLVKGFIFPRNFFPGIVQRFINKYIHRISREKMLNVIDIDYVMDVIKDKIPLNIESIKKQSIPLYVKCLNIRSGNVEYFPTTNHDVFELLRASCCMAPYSFDTQEIDGKYYIDGTIGEPIGLRRLRKLYPEHKIVFISNNRGISRIRHSIKGFLEGIVASLMYGKKFLIIFNTRERKVKKDLKFAEKDSNILIITAPKDNPTRPRTRDRKTLQQSYNLGLKEVDKILDFLRD